MEVKREVALLGNNGKMYDRREVAWRIEPNPKMRGDLLLVCPTTTTFTLPFYLTELSANEIVFLEDGEVIAKQSIDTVAHAGDSVVLSTTQEEDWGIGD
jgi:hypothetical protein